MADQLVYRIDKGVPLTHQEMDDNFEYLDTNKESVFSKNTAFNKDFGISDNTVCEGNDTRLSDARESLIHDNEKHTENYINDTDSRLTDARTPLIHGDEAHNETYAKISELFSKDYNDLINIPGTFTPENHGHDASELVSGVLHEDRIPSQFKQSKAITVNNETERFALTISEIGVGDTVKQLDTGIMYLVVDDANLNNSSGYWEYFAGDINNVDWSIIQNKPLTAIRWPAYEEVTNKPEMYTKTEVDDKLDGFSSSVDQDVTSSINLGNISAGETITSGTSLRQVLELLLVKTFYPTFVSLSSDLSANISNIIEAGTQQDIVLTFNFNRGQIKGDLVNNIWDENTVQDFRAGSVINYVIEGVDKGTLNSHNITSKQIIDGNNIFSGEVFYSEGPQPYDSKQNPYDLPLPASSINASHTVYGKRKLFYGVNIAEITSNDVRTLDNSVIPPSNGTQFTINIPAGTENVVFAYPDSLRPVSSVKYVEGLNAEVKDVFELISVNVAGANEYNPIGYKLYRYTPAEPFSSDATYNVTI